MNFLEFANKYKKLIPKLTPEVNKAFQISDKLSYIVNVSKEPLNLLIVFFKDDNNEKNEDKKFAKLLIYLKIAIIIPSKREIVVYHKVGLLLLFEKRVLFVENPFSYLEYLGDLDT
ncbi:3717_t:CDS:2, partial [Funneliformis caledonium]